MSPIIITIIFVFSLVTFVQLSSPPECVPRDNCEFYVECVENKKPCGPSGYIWGYAYKYCQKFGSKTFRTQEAYLWYNHTRRCLQEQLLPVIQEIDTYSCEQITDFALYVAIVISLISILKTTY
jgi:hypothetical protein